MVQEGLNGEDQLCVGEEETWIQEKIDISTILKISMEIQWSKETAGCCSPGNFIITATSVVWEDAMHDTRVEKNRHYYPASLSHDHPGKKWPLMKNCGTHIIGVTICWLDLRTIPQVETVTPTSYGSREPVALRSYGS